MRSHELVRAIIAENAKIGVFAPPIKEEEKKDFLSTLLPLKEQIFAKYLLKENRNRVFRFPDKESFFLNPIAIDRFSESFLFSLIEESKTVYPERYLFTRNEGGEIEIEVLTLLKP
jgi:hypothetical protein